MVRLFVQFFFYVRRKKGFRVYDSSVANPIDQINNRKDVQKPLVIKTHFTFKSLPKDISSELKKPKVNEYFVLTSTPLFPFFR
jgi:hypothetical protein